jgi:hypothetical protein
VAIDTSTGTLGDAQLAVLDGSGILATVNDDSSFSLDPFAGASLAPSTHWVLVREYGNGTGTFQLHVRPILYFADTITNRSLYVNDKAGRQVHAFAALQALPAPLPMPFPFQGNLLLDVSLHVYLGAQTVPATGFATWPINFQPFPVLLQGLTHDPAPGLLLMTELVR